MPESKFIEARANHSKRFLRTTTRSSRWSTRTSSRGRQLRRGTRRTIGLCVPKT